MLEPLILDHAPPVKAAGELKETRQSLLLRLRDARDGVAWGDFAAIYTPLIFRFLRGRRLQEADAADVTQDVLRAVARAIGQFEYDARRGRFRDWLFKVIRSKLATHFEASRRQPQGSGRTSVHERLEAEPVEVTESAWDHELVQHVLRWAAEKVAVEFQARTWQAFWRTAVLGEEAARVASTLGMSVGAVYIARSRVLSRLKERLAAMGDHWPTRGAALGA